MSTYADFAYTKPDGENSPATVIADANKNDIALWYGVVMGNMKGFVMSVNGGSAEEPAQYLWANGVNRVRATNTWSNGYLVQQAWEVSQNSGTDYASVCTQTFTYDGASGALTSTTGSGGMAGFFGYVIGRLKILWAAFASHAASGNAHGAGTMAVQNANNVAITGGTVSATIEREAKTVLGTINGNQTLDWAAGGLFTATLNNVAASFNQHNNRPSGVVGYLTGDITVTVAPTSAASLFPGVTWFGGTPSFQAGSRAIVTLMCHDGTTINGVKL